eukprot:COSAG01_NODE_46636_length_398_cov_0.869565_2_plen_68_part_01
MCRSRYVLPISPRTADLQAVAEARSSVSGISGVEFSSLKSLSRWSSDFHSIVMTICTVFHGLPSQSSM